MFIFTYKYTHCSIRIKSLVFQMEFRGNEFIFIIIYSVYYAHGLSQQIHEQIAFITFSTWCSWLNISWICLYLLRLQTWWCTSAYNRDYVTTLRLRQRFEPRKAAEAHSIQTNLKVKHLWNLISYAGTKHVFPTNSASSTLPIYCNSTNFSLLVVFLNRIPATLPSLTRTPFYSRFDCYGR